MKINELQKLLGQIKRNNELLDVQYLTLKIGNDDIVNVELVVNEGCLKLWAKPVEEITDEGEKSEVVNLDKEE